MTEGKAHKHVAGAEPPEVSGDRRVDPDTLVATATDRAPPPVSQAGEQERPTSPTPVATTDDVVRPQQVGAGPVEPPRPVQVGGVVVWVPREASDPFVLPPKGNFAFVLGNKYVWRRFMVSTVVVAIAILIVAVALKIAGVQLDGVITVSIAAAATALGITARAYLEQRRRTEQAPASDTVPDDVSSPSPAPPPASGGDVVSEAD